MPTNHPAATALAPSDWKRRWPITVKEEEAVLAVESWLRRTVADQPVRAAPADPGRAADAKAREEVQGGEPDDAAGEAPPVFLLPSKAAGDLVLSADGKRAVEPARGHDRRRSRPFSRR